MMSCLLEFLAQLRVLVYIPQEQQHAISHGLGFVRREHFGSVPLGFQILNQPRLLPPAYALPTLTNPVFYDLNIQIAGPYWKNLWLKD